MMPEALDACRDEIARQPFHAAYRVGETHPNPFGPE